MLAVLLLSGISANAQSAQLRDYATYSVSTKTYFNALWTADRAEFVNLQQGKNWNLVPSVGLVFGLPSVNLNTGQIAQYKQRQGETKSKLKSLELRYELLLNEALNNLRIELTKASIEQQKITSLATVLATKKRIFTIGEEAYRKHEISPLDYYRERLAYESAQQDFELTTSAYQVVVLNIEKLAHYHMPHEVIYYTEGEAGGRDNGLDTLPEALPLTKP